MQHPVEFAPVHWFFSWGIDFFPRIGITNSHGTKMAI